MPFDCRSNLPTIPWNDCPPSRGIRAHHRVEHAAVGMMTVELGADVVVQIAGDGECPAFCVLVIWSMLPERSKDDDDLERTYAPFPAH